MTRRCRDAAMCGNSYGFTNYGCPCPLVAEAEDCGPDLAPQCRRPWWRAVAAGDHLAYDEGSWSEAGRNHSATRLSRSGSPAAVTEPSPNASDQSHLPLASARSAGIEDSRYT